MGQKNNLLFFGIGSFIGHAIFAALLYGSITDKKVINIRSVAAPQPLQISMIRNAKSAITKNTVPKNSEPRLTSIKPAAPENKSQPDNRSDIDAVAITQSDKVAAKEDSAPSAQPSTEKDSAKSLELARTKNALIHERLVALINIHKKYPVFAARRGWQGIVQLGFRIEPDGKFSKVRVLKTSGYSILDEAALTMLTSASHLNGVESWLDGNYFDTTLPIEYQLIDG